MSRAYHMVTRLIEDVAGSVLGVSALLSYPPPAQLPAAVCRALAIRMGQPAVRECRAAIVFAESVLPEGPEIDGKAIANLVQALAEASSAIEAVLARAGADPTAPFQSVLDGELTLLRAVRTHGGDSLSLARRKPVSSEEMQAMIAWATEMPTSDDDPSASCAIDYLSHSLGLGGDVDGYTRANSLEILAQCLAMAGRVQEAAMAVEAAVRSWSHSDGARDYVQLAHVMLQCGQSDRAAQILREGIRIASESSGDQSGSVYTTEMAKLLSEIEAGRTA